MVRHVSAKVKHAMEPVIQVDAVATEFVVHKYLPRPVQRPVQRPLSGDEDVELNTKVNRLHICEEKSTEIINFPQK